jgi:hypothetical protein
MGWILNLRLVKSPERSTADTDDVPNSAEEIAPLISESHSEKQQHSDPRQYPKMGKFVRSDAIGRHQSRDLERPPPLLSPHGDNLILIGAPANT